jgi:uncharacterized protein (DUF1810 family)
MKNSMKDTYNPEYFIKAQAGIYETVMSELKDGYKRTLELLLNY